VVALPPPAVSVDDERPPLCEAARGEHTVFTRRRLRRIAQNRVIEPQRLCKFCIGVRIIDARRNVLDVESPEFLAARPERPAFGRSPPGERLRKPRQHHRRTADKLAETVRSTIRTRQREIRRTITGLEPCRWMVRAKHSVCERGSNRDERDRNRSQH
jgi:hypothetical protein